MDFEKPKIYLYKFTFWQYERKGDQHFDHNVFAAERILHRINCYKFPFIFLYIVSHTFSGEWHRAESNPFFDLPEVKEQFDPHHLEYPKPIVYVSLMLIRIHFLLNNKSLLTHCILFVYL